MDHEDSKTSLGNCTSDEVISLGGPVDRVKVSLRVTGDDLVPDGISNLLGCNPSKACKKGDSLRPNMAKMKTGVWMLDAQTPETLDLDSQLSTLFASVSNDLELWKTLSIQFNIDIVCGLFLENCNRGFGLSCQSMKALVERGISLDFHIYFL